MGISVQEGTKRMDEWVIIIKYKNKILSLLESNCYAINSRNNCGICSVSFLPKIVTCYVLFSTSVEVHSQNCLSVLFWQSYSFLDINAVWTGY